MELYNLREAKLIMPQFFIDKKFDKDDLIDIRGNDARHILGALRLGLGDWILLSDGEGKNFRAVIEDVRTNSLTARLGERLKRRNPAPPPVLALAFAKKERFEWCIEKAVELGCTRIIPFLGARCVAKLGEDAAKKKRRWNEIALSAAKQSGLPTRPCIDDPTTFEEVCKISGQFDHAVMFFEGEDKLSADIFWGSLEKKRGEKHLIFVGPEGGFTSKEISLAATAGIKTLSLGPQILRVETAAISAIAIWQYNLGNMSARP
jgi:16S rRNA (uracil1498-N3)-methyltransferase